MNLAFVFKGPVRPDAESAKASIMGQILPFMKAGHQVDIYLETWINEKSEKLVDMFPDAVYVNLEIEPTVEECLQQFTARTKSVFENPARKPESAFKHFYKLRKATQLLKDSTYDRVVITRMDLHLDVGNPDVWLNSDKYVMDDVATFPVSDLFGIAPPLVMARAWDYKSIEVLNNLTNGKDNPERVFMAIMEMNGVEYEKRSPRHLDINQERYK